MLMQSQLRMSPQEFAAYVAERIRSELPPEYADAEVTTREMVKENDTRLMALDVRRAGEHIVPTIFLNGLYERYMQGEDLAGLIREVAEVRLSNDISERVDNRTITNNVMDYGLARKNLVISICCTEWNRKRLEGKVCRTAGEFTETYRVAVDLGNPESVTFSSVTVTEDILAMWGISREQLHEDALLAEDERTPSLFCMEDLMTEFATGKKPENLFDRAAEEGVPHAMPMFCLTTDDRVNGSALMLRDDILAKAGDILGDDYVILPPSCHEVLLIPENAGFDVEDLAEMVTSVNQEQVLPQERLSDHVHFYDRQNHLLINTHDGQAVSEELDHYREEYALQEKKQEIPEMAVPQTAKPHKRRGR